MSEQPDDLRELLERAATGDTASVGELFRQHYNRLLRMIHLRLDHRLQGRLDASDVLQEAYLEYARALPKYLKNPEAPFYLWLRCIAARKLHALHRKHLGARMRDAARELSINRGALPEASSIFLAAQLLGKLTTPSQAMLRAEVQSQIQDALNEMQPLDREVLALRHYEQLSNSETAHVLDLSEAAASIRFIRALRRLKEILRRTPGLLDAAEPQPRENLGSSESHDGPQNARSNA
jgi:RNA polymerase sigma-70 factor (ECF subfamily)